MRSASALPTIDSTIGPAPAAALFVALLTAFALFGLIWVGAPIWLRLLLAMAAALAGAVSSRRLLRPRWRRIRFSSDELSLTDAAGTNWPARMVGHPFVSPFYVGFRWRAPGGGPVRAFGLFRGQLTPDAHRRLVTRLRYHRNR